MSSDNYKFPWRQLELTLGDNGAEGGWAGMPQWVMTYGLIPTSGASASET